MSDSTTERFALPFILPGQSQKEAFHNEALTTVDMLMHPAIEEGPVDTPPLLPVPGQCWIVGSTPIGDWEEAAGSIAMWTASGWRHANPVPGLAIWNKAEGHYLYWDGTIWTGSLATAGLAIGGVQVVGARQPPITNPSGGTVIDIEARAALAGVIAALMTHGLVE